MQIHNESGRDAGMDVVGSRTSATKAETRSTELADGRRVTPEREAQIRQRVTDGTYNSLSVVDELARRLLRSADL